jgi:aspartyl-tRNA synthetase
MSNQDQPDSVIVEERSDEEKAAIKAARDARKAEKERLKMEKEAKKAAEKVAQEASQVIRDITYLSVDEQDAYEPVGDLSRVMSRSRSGRNFCRVAELEALPLGSKVWLRGRLQSIRVKGGSCFLVLRQDSFDTVQACYFKDKENPEASLRMIRYLKSLTVESIIDLEGTITEAQVQSCSVKTIELSIARIHSVSKAAAQLPFLVEDAARSQLEVEESQDTDRPFPRLGQVRVLSSFVALFAAFFHLFSNVTF